MKATARKVRVDAWWMRLKDSEAQEAFGIVLKEGIVLAAGLIAAKYGIPAPSVSAVSRFYRWAKARETQWRIEKAVADKDQISALMQQLPDIDEKIRAGLDALALDAIASRDPERVTDFVAALTGYMSQKENEKRTALMDRRVTLLEQKAAKADAASAVTADKSLTPAERDAKYREIFSMK